MIIVAIIALSTVVISALFIFFESFPVIPNTFMYVVNQFLPYIVAGVKFVNGYMYPEIVWPLAGVCIAVHTFWYGYRVYMWIIKKVPMLGISD